MRQNTPLFVLQAAHPVQTAARRVGHAVRLSETRNLKPETFRSKGFSSGVYLLGLWGFGDGVVLAAAYHHLPSSAPNKDSLLLAAVHAANAFDHQRVGDGRGVDLDYLRHLNLVDRLDAWREFDGAWIPPPPASFA